MNGSDCGRWALVGGDAGYSTGGCGLDSRDRDATKLPKLPRLKPRPVGFGFNGRGFDVAGDCGCDGGKLGSGFES